MEKMWWPGWVLTDEQELAKLEQGEHRYHSKWSKLDKYDNNYMWNIKKAIQMNLLTKQK